MCEIYRLSAAGEMVLESSLSLPGRRVADVSWHRKDANLIATATSDSFIYIWDMRESRRPVHDVTCHGD